MTSEIKHSKLLSKRIKKDFDFKSTLFPELKTCIELEQGIKQIKYQKEQESLFSKPMQFDTDEEIENFKQNFENREVTLATMKYQLTQKKLTKKRLSLSKWHNKILKLKPLCLKRYPNPINKIRYLEYTFLLDSNIFLDAEIHNLSEYSLCTDVFHYKRAGSVMYDKDKDLFRINLHNKINETCNKKINNQHFKYYIDWLKSLGNSKAIDVVDSLIKLKESHEINKCNLEELKNKFGKKMITKIAIKTIDENTQNKVFKEAYLSRTFKFDFKKSDIGSGLIQEEYSMPFVNLLGYTVSDMEEIISKLLRFEIQQSMYTTNNIQNVFDTINKIRNGINVNTGHALVENLKIKDRFGNDAVKFRLHCWEERWFEEDCLIKKSYCLLTDLEYFKTYI